MNLLLDTHVLLWWLDDPILLSKQALAAIKEPDVEYLTLVTRDSRLRAYDIPILDA